MVRTTLSLTCLVFALSSNGFHDLFNSPSGVLFNFPSRYLFAIGLVDIFSLRWSLPPALRCINKQRDSRDRVLSGPVCRSPTGLLPSTEVHVTVDMYSEMRQPTSNSPHTRHRTQSKDSGLRAELLPFQSPLLRESLLVSFPPLSNMLKLGG